jgi:hypothetical protein
VARSGATLCVREKDIALLIHQLRECTNKTNALAELGVQPDDSKIREVVLHADGHEVRIEVRSVRCVCSRCRQVDYVTQRLPVGDTLHLFGFSETSTDNLLVEYRHRYPDIFESIGAAIQVNGVGNLKLCADLKTMLRILWLLPTNARTAAFRLKCAEDILRQMRGDVSLVAELRRNHEVLQSTGGLHLRAHRVVSAPLGIVVSPVEQNTEKLNVIRLLQDTLRINTEDAVHRWTRAITLDPQLARCFVYESEALVDEDLVNRCAPRLLGSKPGGAPHQLRSWRSSEKRGELGDFCPVMKWSGPHEAAPSSIVWVYMPRMDELGWWVDLDDLLAKKYSLSKSQAAKYRTRCQDHTEPQSIVRFTSTGRIRWICTLEVARRLQLKIDTKRNAEAERMYEHTLAQTYVCEGICGIEIVCDCCTKKASLSTLGRRVRELAWKGYKLDVGVILGGEVVTAIEIRNTCAVSDGKADAFRSEGLQWAEVTAMDVITAVKSRLDRVTALRGGGVCRGCGHSETRTTLATNIVEFEQCRAQALKRKIAAENEISEMNVAIESTRDKIARLK